MDINDDNTKCDDETLHRDAEKIEKYYMGVIGRLLEEEFEAQKHTLPHGEWQRVLNYCNDQQRHGGSAAECRDFRMRVPFSCLISGKSQCGKTELLLSVLSQWRYITTDHNGEYNGRLYWFYGTASIDQTNRYLRNGKNRMGKWRKNAAMIRNYILFKCNHLKRRKYDFY